jgi:ABC-type lipoprotein export system ATPase subunit
MTESGLRVGSVSHRYAMGPLVLDNVDMFVASGEAVALMGPSGSGKTTLLSIMGLLTRPVSGFVAVDGSRLPQRGWRLDAVRAELFSWIFQTVNVLGQRTATDNAALGLVARGVPRSRAAQQANTALAAVGLAGRNRDEVAKLSGGELQRVCIARAMAAVPRFVLADEPTGQLDHATSELVVNVLWEARHSDTALVIATHDPMVAQRCDRVIGLVGGHAVDQGAP